MCPFWATLFFLVGHSLCVDLSNPFFTNINVKTKEDLQKVYPNNPFFKATTKTTERTTTTTTTKTTSSTSLSKNTDICGKALTANQLIVNGQKTNQGDWPWIVAIFLLRYPNDHESEAEFRCGGSLINKRHIVSAGHCFAIKDSQLVQPEDLDAYLGMFDITRRDDPNIQHRQMERIFVHPDYKYGTYSDADIAVLRMKSPAEYTIHVRPICTWIWTSNLRDVIGMKGTLVGWGRNEVKEGPTDEPQLIDLPIVSQEECRRSDSRFEYFTSNRTFCAGLKDDAGPCNGDSGSGFIIKLKDNGESRWFLRGITSISLLDRTQSILCNLRQYVVFTDVAQYGSWLRNVASDE